MKQFLNRLNASNKLIAMTVEEAYEWDSDEFPKAQEAAKDLIKDLKKDYPKLKFDFKTTKKIQGDPWLLLHVSGNKDDLVQMYKKENGWNENDFDDHAKIIKK